MVLATNIARGKRLLAALGNRAGIIDQAGHRIVQPVRGTAATARRRLAIYLGDIRQPSAGQAAQPRPSKSEVGRKVVHALTLFGACNALARSTRART